MAQIGKSRNGDIQKTKEARRDAIRRLTSAEQISTQMELTRRLQKEGFPVTQATVSRDIRELGLIKISDGDGTFHYEPVKTEEPPQASDTFYRMFRESVVKVERAVNQVVIRTHTGMAQAVCATMDKMEWPGVVGTLAGDDTILIIAGDEEKAEVLLRLLKEI